MALMYTYFFKGIENDPREELVIYAPSRKDAERIFAKFFPNQPIVFLRRERF